MFCEKCGSDNSETARFCRKCGASLDAEIETRVVPRADYIAPSGAPGPLAGSVVRPQHNGDEQTIFEISPTLLFVKVGYVAAAIFALMLVALLSIFSVPAWISIILALSLFLLPAYFHVQQRLVRYTLTESKIEIDRGLVARTTRNIPLTRIQDVTVSASVLHRMLGFGDLVLDNASQTGGKVVLKNINTPQRYADQLLRQMRLLEK